MDQTPPVNAGSLVASPSFENMPASSYATPKSSPQYETVGNVPGLSNHRMVQFGPTRAVEYESNDPALTLTPMPPDEAAKRYPTEMKPPTDAETSLLQETKENTALLNEWENQEDDDSESLGFTLIEQSDDSSEEGAIPSEIFRPSTSNRKRRSSSFFLPSAGSTGLLDEDSDDGDKRKMNRQRRSSSVHVPATGSSQLFDGDEDNKQSTRSSSVFLPSGGSTSSLDKENGDEHKLRKNSKRRSIARSQDVGHLDEDSENDDQERSDISDTSSGCTEENPTPSDKSTEGTNNANSMALVNLPNLSITSPTLSRDTGRLPTLEEILANALSGTRSPDERADNEERVRVS